MKKRFDRIVSLGSFCSVAMELEKKGLREASYPFDWMISDRLEEILHLMQNDFADFLNPAFIHSEHRKEVCFNEKTGMHFYHDFNGNDTIEAQIPALKEKYERRIRRFYSDISSPTLFVRYCIRPEDEEYIRNKREAILKYLKTFNSENSILYVFSGGRNELMTDESEVLGFECTIRQPENDFVRGWIDAVPGLSAFLYSSLSPGPLRILRNILICYRKKLIRKIGHMTNKFLLRSHIGR